MRKNFVFDIKSPNKNYFSPPQIVFLLPVKKNNFNKFLFLKILILLNFVWFFAFGFVNAPTIPILAANDNNLEERKALESQLQELERQMAEYEKQIQIYQKQGKSLKNEIDTLNTKIAKINLQIQALTLKIKELDQKINETQKQIYFIENQIVRQESDVIELLKKIYTNDQESLLVILLKNPKLSDFFSDLNNIVLLQENLRIRIKEIKNLKGELEEQKTQYALARADNAALHQYQLEQKNQIDQLKKEKDYLLTVTKGQESKYKTLLQKTKEEAAKIRARIFELLGGGELTFEQAYQYAKLASKVTGVRPAFILAVLDRESALGRNVGRCNYKTAMNPKDQPIFLEIVSKLGLNPDTLTVSCPNADGPYGGAMGPAQFLPSTWKIYESQISQITGNNPPSPWNNADAFVATALYLKDAGALQNERQAAAKYYCGSRWNRYVCTQVYAQKVLEKAEQFEDDIQTITNY